MIAVPGCFFLRRLHWDYWAVTSDSVSFFIRLDLAKQMVPQIRIAFRTRSFFFFFLLEKWNKKSQPNKQYGEIFLSTARWKSSRWSWLKLIKKSRVRSVSNCPLHIIQLMLWRACTKGLMYAIWAQNRENKTEMFAARTFDHKSREKLDACIN